MPLMERAEVPGDLHLEPRRVLHDPRRRPARPGRRRPRRPRARRAHAVAGHRRAARAHRRARPSARRAARRTSCARRWPSTASAIVADGRGRPTRSATALDERFRRQIFPVLTPLAVGLGRPFPYISNLSLSLAVLVRDPQTQVTTFARVKVPKEMLPRFVPAGDERRPDLRRAGGAHRGQPRRALPGHGDRRPRLLPRHARRRLRDLRRGRRPAARPSRPSCAAGASARSCASRSTASMSPDAARRADPGARGRGAPGLRRRRAARPHRPVADRQAAGLQRPARRAVDAGDPAAPAGRGRRPRRHLQRHPRRRRPRPPPLRLVRDLGRALRRAGGQRPRRPGHQDDRLPHERRHAARARAHPRHRARQAGGVPGRGQGARRRARQHPVGARDGGGGRPRRLRAPGAQDARQVPARGAPRGRRRAPLRPHRDRQLPPADGAPLHGLRPLHLRRADRRRRGRHVQLPHRLRAPAALPQGAGGAQLPARRDDRRDRAHGGRARGGPAARGSR